MQCVLFAGETISKGMVTFASKIPKESIIEIVASVAVPDKPIESCTQQVELHCLVVTLWTHVVAAGPIAGVHALGLDTSSSSIGRLRRP